MRDFGLSCKVMDWNQHFEAIIAALIVASGGITGLVRWQTETRYRELRDILGAQQETIHIQQETIDQLYDRIASIEIKNQLERETIKQEYLELQNENSELKLQLLKLQKAYDDLKSAYNLLIASA